jgi:hypothetical protein
MLLDIACWVLFGYVLTALLVGRRTATWMMGGLVMAGGIGLILFYAIAIGTFVIATPAMWGAIGFIVLVAPGCDWLLGGTGRL